MLSYQDLTNWAALPKAAFVVTGIIPVATDLCGRSNLLINDSQNEVWISELTIVEFLSVMYHLYREGKIVDDELNNQLYGELIIPEAVWREVVVEGSGQHFFLTFKCKK